jgi:DNA polymerase-3 subunit beta
VETKRLADVVKGLSGELTLEKTDKNHLIVSAAGSKYRIFGTVSSEFPKIPLVESGYFEIDSAVFGSLLSRTAFASSIDESRVYLTGVFLEQKDDRLVAVATDGHRLSMVSYETGSSVGGIIVPRRAALELVKIVQGSKTCDVAVTDRKMFVRSGSIVIGAELVDAQFPPYEQIIPSDLDHEYKCKREDLLRALKRIGIVSDGGGVLFDHNDALVMTADNPDAGDAEEVVEIEHADSSDEHAKDKGETFVMFNGRYMVDALEQIDSDVVTIKHGDSADPVVVTDDNYLGLIMPMRP